MRTYALPSATLVLGSEQEFSFGEVQSLNLKLCPTLPFPAIVKTALLSRLKFSK
jgi:hypothetical protein